MLSVQMRVFFIWVLMLLCTSAGAQTEGLRRSLFEDTEKLLMEVKKENAALLAPVGYKKGFEAFSRASKRYKKSKNIEKVESDLATARDYFEKAKETLKLSNLTFGSTIKARNDAKGVEAKKLAEEMWLKAEKQFKSAAVSLETGRMSAARKKAAEAEEHYREAELISIQSSYLSQARKYIARAKREKVGRYAPSTLNEAEVLLRKAERELTDNRYDADYPRSLAKQSLYQAKHSIFLADYIQQLKKRDVTTEHLLLDLEQPLILIADTLDLVAEFDQGFDHAGLVIKKEISRIKLDAREYIELRAKLEKLEIDHDGLEERLGVKSRNLARQESQKGKIKKISSMFSPNEVDIFVKDDNVIVRALGLSFEPGSSKITSRNRGLLQRLKNVFTVFDGYPVVIEGHTDSFGSDSANLLLSFDRASAVRSYFLSNVRGLTNANTDVRGFGETKPIGNNETASGRARNRRIDLVFTPRN